MIETVHRVRCDECRGWLAYPEDFAAGEEVDPFRLEVSLTAERACLFASPGHARVVALRARWVRGHGQDDLVCCLCTGRRLARLSEMAQLVRDLPPNPERLWPPG